MFLAALKCFPYLENVPSLVSTAVAEPEPHVSLSKTFYTSEMALGLLNSKLRSVFHKTTPSLIRFDRLEVYQNESCSRSFLAMDVDEASALILSDLVKEIDSILVPLGFEPYYDPPSFHASLCWAPDDDLKHLDLSLLNISFPIDWPTWNVYFRAGNRLYTIL